MKKNIILILFFIVHLTLSLKSIDFCIAKQEACKGFYDEKHEYKIKCEPIKCHTEFSYDCGSSVCSRNIITCNGYKNALSKFMKIVNLIHYKNPKLAAKYLKEKNKTQIITKHIKYCQNNFKFTPNDFCLNGKNCVEMRKDLIGFGFNYRSLITAKKVDCKCPASKSFKCDKYCATDSIACDYYKILENQKHFINISECGNRDTMFKISFYNKFFKN